MAAFELLNALDFKIDNRLLLRAYKLEQLSVNSELTDSAQA